MTSDKHGAYDANVIYNVVHYTTHNKETYTCRAKALSRPVALTQPQLKSSHLFIVYLRSAHGQRIGENWSLGSFDMQIIILLEIREDILFSKK